ncbi:MULTISPECIES: hypothetical protein [Streptomyces]|uniref:hypothetical protein n=1 Tax=Streptomyces TaxID=1883 RepID=UPI001319E90B|nr:MULTISPECIES: hypothetical protein [Streptomyces]MYS92399.1 hypothetical protein [Streptomyces sp. SID5464]
MFALIAGRFQGLCPRRFVVTDAGVINAVCPGVIDTPMVADMGTALPVDGGFTAH